MARGTAQVVGTRLQRQDAAWQADLVSDSREALRRAAAEAARAEPLSMRRSVECRSDMQLSRPRKTQEVCTPPCASPTLPQQQEIGAGVRSGHSSPAFHSPHSDTGSAFTFASAASPTAGSPCTSDRAASGGEQPPNQHASIRRSLFPPHAAAVAAKPLLSKWGPGSAPRRCAGLGTPSRRSPREPAARSCWSADNHTVSLLLLGGGTAAGSELSEPGGHGATGRGAVPRGSKAAASAAATGGSTHIQQPSAAAPQQQRRGGLLLLRDATPAADRGQQPRDREGGGGGKRCSGPQRPQSAAFALIHRSDSSRGLHQQPEAEASAAAEGGARGRRRTAALVDLWERRSPSASSDHADAGVCTGAAGEEAAVSGDKLAPRSAPATARGNSHCRGSDAQAEAAPARSSLNCVSPAPVAELPLPLQASTSASLAPQLPPPLQPPCRPASTAACVGVAGAGPRSPCLHPSLIGSASPARPTSRQVADLCASPPLLGAGLKDRRLARILDVPTCSLKRCGENALPPGCRC